MASSDLFLKSLEIRRFRGIPELRVNRLGRVNLIVGKNNVGKSTVLEALRLFARPGSLDPLLEILVSRNEIEPEDIQVWNRTRIYALPVHNLFHGRRPTFGDAGSIVIGPAGESGESLRISLEDTQGPRHPEQADTGVSDGEPEGLLALAEFGGVGILDTGVSEDETGRPQKTENDVSKIVQEKKVILRFRFGTGERRVLIKQPISYWKASTLVPVVTVSERERGSMFQDLPSFSVGPNGLDVKVIGRLWDEVALSPNEQDVITALRIISPDVDRVALKEPASRPGLWWSLSVPVSSFHESPRARIPFVKLRGDDEPIPLRSLGDGMNRLFGIALALVSARGGFLLVDEIENGIHYSVQADLWRLVFKTACRLGVQVFATTHSYDCIKAFEEAARESEEEGVLIRLAQKAGRTLVGEFDENELGIAVEGQIEVR